MGNASACLSPLCNILAMKLLIRNRTSQYGMFRPSYALIPDLLESTKKSGILLQEGPQIKQGSI